MARLCIIALCEQEMIRTSDANADDLTSSQPCWLRTFLFSQSWRSPHHSVCEIGDNPWQGAPEPLYKSTRPPLT